MATADDAPAGSLAQAVSRELVALMKEYHGRGPMKARSYIRDNLVVCVMQQAMTKAERHVARDKGGPMVRGSRRLYQDSMRDDASAAIERLLGRRVVSFLSDHDTEVDYLAYVFVLEPDGADGDPHFQHPRAPETPRDGA